MSLRNPFCKVWVIPHLFDLPRSPRPEQSALTEGMTIGKHGVVKYLNMNNRDHRNALKNEAKAYIRLHAANIPQDGLTPALSRVLMPSPDSPQRALFMSRLYGPSLQQLNRSPYISDEELAKITHLGFLSHRSIAQRTSLVLQDRHGHNMIVTLGGENRQTPRVAHIDFGTRALDLLSSLDRESYRRQTNQLLPALSYPPLQNPNLAAFSQAGLTPDTANTDFILRSSHFIQERLLTQFRDAGRDVPNILRHFYQHPENAPPQLAPATLRLINDEISRQQASFPGNV